MVTRRFGEKEMPNYEDLHVIATAVPNMHRAIEVINKTEFADLLLHIVPTDDGFWLVWKDDSGLAGRLGNIPGIEILRK
jgi:hypothetical protein